MLQNHGQTGRQTETNAYNTSASTSDQQFNVVYLHKVTQGHSQVPTEQRFRQCKGTL